MIFLDIVQGFAPQYLIVGSFGKVIDYCVTDVFTIPGRRFPVRSGTARSRPDQSIAPHFLQKVFVLLVFVSWDLTFWYVACFVFAVVKAVLFGVKTGAHF